MSARRDRLLFAVHAGMYQGHPAGIIMSDHCLPIAVGDSSHEAGLKACWEAFANVEEFFAALELEAVGAPDGDDHANGLFVYEIEWEDADAEGDGWSHLADGAIRRPTASELTHLAFGRAPWSDGEVL